MKISYNWLKSFVDLHESPEEIAEIVTRLSFECESIEHYKRWVDGVIVGKVLEAVKHPNADKLQLTKVNTGSEILSIVCGAPNCREGLKVAVATIGTQIGDFKIAERKLRGELSQGMLMSEKEMGISDESGGIMELPQDLELGTPLSTLVEPEDWVIDFEITVNRPDALSHLGIAREIAAKFDRKLKYPSYNVNEVDRPTADKVKIDILNPEQGPRYVGRMIEGIKVQESPLWMRALLHSLGQRPINNIVDITNYVLFELGHPLHAFDYNFIKDGHVIVRLAEKGEKITTLDCKERKLDQSDLLITDENRAVGIAGVMGGENSEVNETTIDVLIEAAYFDPPTVRRTAKRQGLQTEASRRFERGADPSMAPNAAARCAQLIQAYAGGDILKGFVDAYPTPLSNSKVSFRTSRAKHILGMDVNRDQAEKIFRSLEFDVDIENDDVINIIAPTYRHDIEREIDLVEEVVRMVGYDEVPTNQTSGIVLNAPDSPIEELSDKAIDTMISMGFKEAICSSMTSGDDQKLFQGDLKPLAIERPLNPEMNVYRASMVPGLLRSVEHNINRGHSNVRLVEVGQVGGKGWFGIENNQRLHLSAVLTGTASSDYFDRKGSNLDLADLKGVILTLASGLSLDNSLQFSYDVPNNLIGGISLQDDAGNPLLIAGELTTEIANNFGIQQPVFIIDIDLQRWIPIISGDIKRPGIVDQYSRFSRFPATSRDIAFIVSSGIYVGDLHNKIVDNSGELCENVELFDIYQGKPLEDDERSLAFRISFRAMDKTLTDEEIEPHVSKIVNEVLTIDGVRQRS